MTLLQRAQLSFVHSTKVLHIFLLLLALVFLYIIFFKNRVVISENMTNTEFHKNNDYNV